ncbi:NAD dependent epimerase/dehydratase family protein [Streptomyces sp. YIM 130001]|uniref:NAD-dependent epimerase/dehydratase family protein n=1 Tax=Streptomyces sp. YIM 130001 TaxID=2259644 RepID=UPI000E655525|nr:NAD-dependent epimerase/dehydratase family protein [Streptomyces sp. YIM 130001]RII17098.1 NAD dependent epimerase/dehydratase family protein [Streptomyces sp. YIM 130001]
MRLLILGGTEFVGRAVAEAATTRGHDVTVFHRGRHDPPSGVTALHGDRLSPDGLAALTDGEWDAVVDTWSGAPRAVRDTAQLLAGRVAHYLYVSSCSVYDWPRGPGADESARLVAGAPDAEQTDYAADKRGGELAALEAFGEDHSLFARAGLILGPYENVGRLPWWLGRIAAGGPVLAPGPRDMPLQYIDARDLAEWILDAAADGLSGPYNLVGPQGHTTTGGLLEACLRATGSTSAELRWTAPETVLAAGIEPWNHLPAWLPPGSDLYDGLFTVDVQRALATGLRCRPVEETVEATWAWLQSIGGTAPQRPDRPAVGVPPELEAKVLGEGA